MNKRKKSVSFSRLKAVEVKKLKINSIHNHYNKKNSLVGKYIILLLKIAHCIPQI